MAPATMRSYEDGDAKSATSHRSTQSSRSSVLERARAYNRRIEDQNRRAKSAERMSEGGEQQQHDPVSPRSQSAGRQGNRVSTRERAMASVRHDTSRDESSYLSQQNSSRNGESFQSSNPRSPGSQRSPNVSQSTSTPRKQSHQRPDAATPRSSASKQKSQQQRSKSRGEEPQEAVVSPELLVDALSGHEDGLLAIAEKLMEHYDQGYDVMGEAIIDAFADVQKLFQHVVEAAHMEGAAFEASRREVEVAELRKKATAAGNGDIPASPTNNGRHDEFIDQDVKDILTEAINNGAALRDAGKHMECYELYESSCQNASSLLPVDSDHRGRLQLSIARAESMSPDRACAILRYAMDDVLRSGLRADKGLPPNLEVSKRSDMVLSKPKDLPSISGEIAGVVQSSEEALASLVEELKEVLGAPVYDNTPLQSVARRFWAALADAQRSQQKNEERLEQNLAKLKGEFLMARAEWEEKLTASRDQTENFKKKYISQKETHKGELYMDQARSLSSKWTTQERRDADEDMTNLTFDSVSASKSGGNVSRGPGSAISIGKDLAQSARSLVGSFNCSGMNDRSGPVVASELNEINPSFSSSRDSNTQHRPPRRGRSHTKRGTNSYSSR